MIEPDQPFQVIVLSYANWLLLYFTLGYKAKKHYFQNGELNHPI